MNNKRIAVTGSGGFIGKVLGEFISKKYPAAEITRIRRIDFPDIQDILKDTRPDYIFHLAGFSGNDWQSLYEGNIQTSTRLFDACLAIGLYPTIVIPGSAAQFGTYENDYQIREDSPQNPVSNYGESKKCQNSLSGLYSRRGLPIVTGTIFNIISVDIPERAVVGDLISKVRKLKAADNTGSITIGNLQSYRDFLHIDDICAALLALSLDGKPGESYNICSGDAVSIGEILKLMCTTASVDPEIKYDPAFEQKVNYNYGSNSKITNQLGWKQEIPLEEAIRLLHF